MSTPKVKGTVLLAGIVLLAGTVSPVCGAFVTDTSEERGLKAEPDFIADVNRRVRLGLVPTPKRPLPPKLQGTLLASAKPVPAGEAISGDPEGQDPVRAADAGAAKPDRSRTWQIVLALALVAVAALAVRRIRSIVRTCPPAFPGRPAKPPGSELVATAAGEEGGTPHDDAPTDHPTD